MNLMRKQNPPCPKCPYRLGLVETLVNPCPECKQNDYRFYDELTKRIPSRLPGTDDDV